MLVPLVSAASTSAAPSSRLVSVTVSDTRFALSTSESTASASAMATGPPFSVQVLAKSAPDWPGAVVGVQVQHRRVVDRA